MKYLLAHEDNKRRKKEDDEEKNIKRIQTGRKTKPAIRLRQQPDEATLIRLSGGRLRRRNDVEGAVVDVMVRAVKVVYTFQTRPALKPRLRHVKMLINDERLQPEDNEPVLVDCPE